MADDEPQEHLWVAFMAPSPGGESLVLLRDGERVAACECEDGDD